MKKIFVFLAFWAQVGLADVYFGTMMLNGREAQPGEFPDVVYLTIGGSRCTGTLVGPRAVLTAASCGRVGATVRFQVDQTLHTGRLYPSVDYNESTYDNNLALVLTEYEMEGAQFASISNARPTQRMGLTLAGYGCTRDDGTGGNDGILRVGDNEVSNIQDHTLESRDRAGAVLCFGDFGGPTLRKLSDPRTAHHVIVGVNSNGNIRDFNLSARVDTDEAQTFFKTFVGEHQIEICGINKHCGGVDPEEPKPEPGRDCSDEFFATDSARKLLKIRIDELENCLSTAGKPTQRLSKTF